MKAQTIKQAVRQLKSTAFFFYKGTTFMLEGTWRVCNNAHVPELYLKTQLWRENSDLGWWKMLNKFNIHPLVQHY